MVVYTATVFSLVVGNATTIQNNGSTVVKHTSTRVGNVSCDTTTIHDNSTIIWKIAANALSSYTAIIYTTAFISSVIRNTTVPKSKGTFIYNAAVTASRDRATSPTVSDG